MTTAGNSSRATARACFRLAVTVVFFTCSSTARADERADAKDATLAVLSALPVPNGVFLSETPVQISQTHSRLAHELLREAVILSLGSRPGLVVLDEALEEANRGNSSGSKPALQLEAFIASKKLEVSLTRKQQGSDAASVVWSDSVQLTELKQPSNILPIQVNQNVGEQLGELTMENFSAILAAAERWSSGGIRDAIEKADFVTDSKEPIAAEESDPPRSSVSVQDIERSLHDMNFISQFTALRQAHRFQRTNETSRAVTGYLVRGYANLGLLTEHHWSPLSRGARARSLLYAQRMVASEPQSPTGYWHRAYAWALIGSHAMAIEDLRLANERVRSSSSASPSTTSPELPDWVGVIQSHCQFDDTALQAVPQNSASAQLAGVLLVVQSLAPKVQRRSVQIGRQVLQANPECGLLIDRMCDTKLFGTIRSMVQMAPASLDYNIRKRCAEMRELPNDLEQYLAESQGRSLDVGKVVSLLRGRNVPGSESGTLSWSTLAQLIEQERRVQIWRRLVFLDKSLSAPVDEVLPDALTILLGDPADRALAFNPATRALHLNLDELDATRRERLVNLLELKDLSSSSSPQVPAKAMLAVIANLIDSPSLDPRQVLALRTASDRDFPPMRATGSALHPKLDMVYPEIIGALEGGITRSTYEQLSFALLQVSPHCPTAWASIIRVNPGFAFSHRSLWSKEFAYDAQVLAAMADAKRNDTDPAERIQILQDYISLSPDYWAYQELAAIYKASSQLDLWKETLDEFLKLPSEGLQQSNVRVDIADWLMNQGDYETALPYVTEALESYSATSMYAGIRCYGGLGQLDKAILWYDRLNERYGNRELEFLQWCQRNGSPEVDRAYAAAARGVDVMVAQLPSEKLYAPALLMLAAGKLPRAEQLFSRAFENSTNARSRCFNGMFLVLVAQALGDENVRNAALKSMAALSDPTQATSIELAKILAAAVKEDSGRLDLDQVDQLLKSASSEDQTNLNFVVGRWLELHGQKDQAITHYNRVFKVSKARSYSVYGPAIFGLRRLDALPDDAFQPNSTSEIIAR